MAKYLRGQILDVGGPFARAAWASGCGAVPWASPPTPLIRWGPKNRLQKLVAYPKLRGTYIRILDFDFDGRIEKVTQLD